MGNKWTDPMPDLIDRILLAEELIKLSKRLSLKNNQERRNREKIIISMFDIVKEYEGKNGAKN